MIRVASTILILLFVTLSAPAAVIYVDLNAGGGGGTGDSWPDAFTTIQAGVDAASAASSDEVWVADGTYTSATSPVLTLKANIPVYAGFAGGEGTFELRDWETNVAIIDGQNARRCVIGAESASLDGFTVANGNILGHGAGMLNVSVSPTVANCTFEYNHVTGSGGTGGRGGAMYNESNSAQISDCVFSNNWTSSGGGAIKNYSGSPTVLNCFFNNNESGMGYVGGALDISQSSTSVINCAFYQNQSDMGGAISVYDSTASIVNCTLAQNNVGEDGDMAGMSGGIFVNASTLTTTITNCILSDNGNGQISLSGSVAPVVSYCLVQDADYEPANGNIDDFPGFTGPGNFRLQISSPCINEGDDSAVTVPTDLDGNPRVVDTVDMGAYEYPDDAPTLETNAPSDIGGTTAVLHATVTNQGAAAVTERGFYYSTDTITPLNLGSATKVTVTPDPGGIGAYSYSASGLLEGQSYYVIPYATNSSSTGYGTRNGVTTIMTPTILWANPLPIVYGTALSATQLNAVASVAGTYVYDPAAGTILDAGLHTLGVSFTPDDPVTYTPATGSVQLTVNMATPSVTTWPAASVIVYGDALSDSTLTGAAASADGTFTFDAPLTTPDAGIYNGVAVTFTPTDTANYNTVAGGVDVTVDKAAAVVTLSDLLQYYDGASKSVTVTTVPAALAVDLTYDSNATPPVAIDDYAVIATVDDANYAGSASDTFTIAEVVVEEILVSAVIGQDICLTVPSPGTATDGDFAWTYTPVDGAEGSIPDASGVELCLEKVGMEQNGRYTATYDNGEKALVKTAFELTVEPGVPVAGGAGIALVASLIALSGACLVRRRK